MAEFIFIKNEITCWNKSHFWKKFCHSTRVNNQVLKFQFMHSTTVPEYGDKQFDTKLSACLQRFTPLVSDILLQLF